MTTTTVAPAGRTSTRSVTHSELVKFRSLRSQWGLLLTAALATLVLGPVQSIGPAIEGDGAVLLESTDAVLSVVLSGAATAAIVMGILGAVVVATEYPRHTIQITFAAVPRRGTVVVAKAVALAMIAVTVSTPVAALAFEAARQILVPSGQAAAWTDPGVIRAVLLTGWFLAGWGLIGMALGWVTRNALGAAFAVLGLMAVLPAVVPLFGEPGRTVAPFLPSAAGQAMLRATDSDGVLGPWAAFAVWTAYLVVGLAAGAWRVSRRDA